MRYPDYVKNRPKGTIVKKVNGTFYVYYATSRRVPGKKYPVQVVKGMAGTVDEQGFHPAGSVRVDVDEVVVRECGFTNYMLLFEELYMAQNMGRRSKRANRIIYRSLIVYMSNNSYLNDEKDVPIYTTEGLTEEFGIGIPNQLKAISKLIEIELEKLEPLKYICNVRMGGRKFRNTLTDEQRRILKELEVEEDDIR